MVHERDNSQWIEVLQAEGPLREAALADLRELLIVCLKGALKSSSDFMESLLDDFVQDSLLQILRRLEQFQGRSRFVTWATVIAIRVALTELRKRQWRGVSLEALVANTGYQPTTAVETAQTSERQPIVDTMYRIIALELDLLGYTKLILLQGIR